MHDKKDTLLNSQFEFLLTYHAYHAHPIYTQMNSKVGRRSAPTFEFICVYHADHLKTFNIGHFLLGLAAIFATAGAGRTLSQTATNG